MSIRPPLVKLVVPVLVLAVIGGTTLIFHLTQESYKEFHQGRRLYEAERFHEAAGHFLRAYKTDDMNEQKLFYLVDTHVRLGRDKEIRDALEVYISRDPNDMERALQLAGVYYKLDDYASAGKIYAQWSGREGVPDTVLSDYADVLVWQKNYEDAMPLLAQLHGKYPGNLELTEKLADVSSWTKKYSEAIALYAELEKAGVVTRELYTKWGDALRFSGRDEEAVEVYKKVVKESDNEPTAP